MRLLNALVAVSLVAFAFTAHPAAQAPNAGRAVNGEIIVKFRPGAVNSDKTEAHRQNRGRVKKEIAGTGVQLVEVPVGDETGAINRYQRNPNVLYAERNIIRTIPKPISNAKPTNHVPGSEIVPGDRLFKEQWALHNTGQEFYCFPFFGEEFCFYFGTADADIDAPEAWPLATGTGVTVAVIDTGIDYTHPDLAPNYIGGDDFVTPDGNPMDDHGHGTHVAGTIAAALNNLTGNPGDEEGVVGVAPNARILAYKVCDATGNCSDFAIQQAIAQSIVAGARVINMSLGGPENSQSMNDAVQAAWNAGIVIVAGAGNDGNTNLFYPAALDHVISVGAFDEDGRRASFSNYGTWVDISAPGNVIMSSYPMSACVAANVPGDTGCYTWLSGTSMATPHVAGAAALVWSRQDVTTNQQVVDILLDSADPQGVDAVRLDSWTIHGGLNIHAALSLGSEPSDLTAVTVAASAAQATEAGPTSGTFTITRTGDTSEPLVVNYAVAGTAAPGTDYVALPGTVTIDAGSSTATISVAAIDDTLFENDETVALTIAAGTGYVAGSPASSVVTIVSDDLPADLIVTSMVAPTSSGADADILVTDGTRNQGTGGSVPSSTGFYLSTNTILDAADTFLGSRPVPALAPNTTDTLSTTLHIPPTQAAGTYYVIAKADWNSTIPENVETNNVRASGTITIGPDLIVTALTAPPGAAAGGTFTVSETTKNQGAGSAAETTTRFYLSTNSLLDAADPEIGGRTVPPLNAGVSNQATATTLTVPTSTAVGNYYVIARADAAGVVGETSETNNTRVSAAVRVGPDLILTALTAPATAVAGTTINVSDTTKNQGASPAAASATAFYLSTNSWFDATDTLLGSRPVGALAGNGFETASTPLQIPAGFPSGTYYVLARADGNAAVLETIETNNDRLSGGVRIGADLVIIVNTASATGMANGPITVTDTTSNQGAAAVGQSSTGFYLSNNSTFSADDIRLGSRTVGALAPFTSEAGSMQVTVPANTAPGNYFVLAVADWNGAVLESIETNNARSSNAVRIGPDLTVTSLGAPASAAAGATISATDITMNQGGATAAASVTRFYLSVNSTFDATDTLIGTRDLLEVGPGLSNTGSASLTIPASTTPGTRYIIAKADGADSIVEASEVNNTRARAITITAAPYVGAAFRVCRGRLQGGPVSPCLAVLGRLHGPLGT